MAKVCKRKTATRKLKMERYRKPKNWDEVEKRLRINSRNIETVHDDMQRRLKEILFTQAKILDYIADTRRYKTKINKFEDKLERIENALVHGDRASESGIKEVQEEITREFDRINTIFVSALDKLKKKTDNTELELSGLRERIKDVKNIEENMKELDIKTLRRELEIIKTKNDWMENRMGEINMLPLEQKISLLEKKLRAMKYTSPLIIE